MHCSRSSGSQGAKQVHADCSSVAFPRQRGNLHRFFLPSIYKDVWEPANREVDRPWLCGHAGECPFAYDGE